MKTVYDFFKKPANTLVWNVLFEDRDKNLMVYIVKEPSDITLESPTGFGVVLTDYIKMISELIYGLVSSLIETTRIRCMGESFIKEGIKDSVDGVV